MKPRPANAKVPPAAQPMNLNVVVVPPRPGYGGTVEEEVIRPKKRPKMKSEMVPKAPPVPPPPALLGPKSPKSTPPQHLLKQKAPVPPWRLSQSLGPKAPLL